MGNSEYTVNYAFRIVKTGVVTTGGQFHFSTMFEVDDCIVNFTPAPGLCVAGTVYRNGKFFSSFERYGEK